MEDFLIGARILGTGGGGSTEWVRIMLNHVWEREKELRLVDPKVVPKDDIVFDAAGVGGGVEERVLKMIKSRLSLPSRELYMKRAVLVEKLMTGYLREEPYALLAFEIGCSNTMLPACVAAMVDRPFMDGDCCRRAVPKIELCTLNIAGISFTPIVAVTLWKEVVIIKGVLDYSRAEDLCRYIAIASAGGCTIASAPMRGRDLEKAIIPNTVSWAMEVGRMVRVARDGKGDPIEALLEATKGFLLFEGRISGFRRKGQGGFIGRAYV